MFWAYFSYDKKGACHYWTPEIQKEKELAEKAIQEMNEALQPIMKGQWELQTQMARLGLRNKPRKKPRWKWDKKNCKLTRCKGEGIDRYQYQSEVLIPKFKGVPKERLIQLCKKIKHLLIFTIFRLDFIALMILRGLFGVVILLI